MYPKASVRGAAAGQNASASPSFPAIEELVLRYWDQDGTFAASIENRPAGNDGDNEFVFYDGPPFANGLPHYGHLLTGYVKDLVGRYQTQRGKRVERRFGWDTHGLPAELEAMKQLGMTDKAEIEAMGIDRFNDACRASVLKYTHEWQDYVTRQARWVDFDHDYKTLNVEYMESVLWAFKTLHEKGLTYSGFRVLPYCWHDETPLSNHELRMDDDVYQMRQDPSVTVAFPVVASGHALDEALAGVRLLAWTTTPWTLPTNAALAVGPDVRYVVLPAAFNGKSSQERFMLAESLVSKYAGDLGYVDEASALQAVESRYSGNELGGLRYEPLWRSIADKLRGEVEFVEENPVNERPQPFPWFRAQANAYQVLVDAYVTTTDGTGIVHQAPAYGEDDQRVCDAAGIPVRLSVDESARFMPSFVDGTELAGIAGLQVFDANRTIIRNLAASGRLVREASFEHSYPHCWRCRNPLIYKAVSSWFVEVTKIKARMVELNQQITWIPGNVKDGQFGTWLANARDWSISRNRYWGSPIPVWQSTDPAYPRTDVYGSLAELEADFGVLPRNHAGEVDLHRPFIDELTRPNPDDPRTPEEGQSVMRRVEDVLDVWFDSGSMPYAQVHYPFENQDWFDHHNPADFIVEYIGQTRGWFYTLHILATALFDRPTFRNVISHGIVLGSDGQKMSKSLRNYPDVSEVLDRDGSDAMRWFLMSSPILRGGNLIVTEQGIRDGVRAVLLPLWNAWHFFALYANAAENGQGYEAQRRTEATDVLDRYLLATTGTLVRDVTTALDAYEVSDACDALRDYLDVLTNWYIRRSRERFFDEDTAAFDVLYTCLETVTRVAAPLLPLIGEEIWRGLTGGRSVHLTDWPDAAEFPADESLLAAMDATRRICSTGSSLRKAANLRVRLPLAGMTVVTPHAEALTGTFARIIADELNLKDVRLVDAATADAGQFGVSQQLSVNARAAGPRLGKGVQAVIKAAKSGDWSVTDGTDGEQTVVAGGVELQSGEYTLQTVVSSDGDASAAVAVLPGGGFVVLDTAVTPELEAEGVARDTIRTIQQARRDADLDISDRIRTRVTGPAALLAALRDNEDLVTGETLTTALDLVEGGDTAVTVQKSAVQNEGAQR
ncbi:isoleucine--tRNA ligase [Tersicoccus solisilvae]|uniref:Isoleucine--tRNA ligase n=1 Tax=Tersicoccus solisilvae TaxID=1882339 RepID=A0ABQ1NXP3_9MICC|nr:isoleucine--tRNA ligase [Tersicoccus solisilvae]GGC85127.1 isoleucine--tRNA ligase [Tersicoccus solisilvae]